MKAESAVIDTSPGARYGPSQIFSALSAKLTHGGIMMASSINRRKAWLRSARALVGVIWVFLEAGSFSPADTFTVNTTADSGPGSLRQAILDANNHPGLDTIDFAIPGTGVQTISVLSMLPDVGDSWAIRPLRISIGTVGSMFSI